MPLKNPIADGHETRRATRCELDGAQGEVSEDSYGANSPETDASAGGGLPEDIVRHIVRHVRTIYRAIHPNDISGNVSHDVSHDILPDNAQIISHDVNLHTSKIFRLIFYRKISRYRKIS